ncbi:MAG TPA: alpha-L-rhamnosidase C-terminal domain-containing protein, partial [Candidatus Acidoferrum sp.]
YGAIGEWMYRVLAGIEIDESHPGYKHLLIQPQPGGGLTFAKASVESMYGHVSSDWKINDAKFTLAIEVPPNTTATVRLPRAKIEQTTESQKQLTGRTDLGARQAGDAVLVEIGSGTYIFESPMSGAN